MGEPRIVRAVCTAPLEIHGRLDHPIWKAAPVYQLQLPGDERAKGKILEEGGQVQFAWDGQHFYVGIRFLDSDVVAEGQRDQMHHFETGDVAELFLRPPGKTYYWELYSTPHGKRTSYFMPGRGRIGLPSNFTYEMDFAVASTVQGTLNDWRSRDESWTTELKIPIRELERHGDRFAPGQAWTVLVARYNYSRFLKQHRGPELSSCPGLPVTDWHYLDGYAELELVK
jgi:hypothetical protein